MNSKFYDFLGQFFTSMAKGQQQYEDLHKWMEHGLKGYEAMTALFRNAYGLENVKEDSPDYLKSWKLSSEEFQRSCKEYLELFDVVSRDEHLRLIKKYEALKDKTADQEETIKHLKELLSEKGKDQEKVVDGFRSLINKQSSDFQDLIKYLSAYFQKEEAAAPTAAPSKKIK